MSGAGERPERGGFVPGVPAAVPVLMYHEIAPPTDTASRLAVPPGVFAGQLARLRDAGFTAVTAGALAEALDGQGGQLPARPIVLTFDDGFADFHGQALPLLQRYGFTATVFVTTGWLGQDGPPLSGRAPSRMLSWRQVAEVDEAGIEIGSHSHRHPQLDQLPARLIRQDLEASMLLLEDRLGHEVAGLAYPFGYSNAGVRRAARDVGHRYACAVSNATARLSSDLFAVPRLTIKRSTTSRAFDRVIFGERVPLVYLRERTLTKGWAVVRRGKAGIGKARQANRFAVRAGCDRASEQGTAP